MPVLPERWSDCLPTCWRLMGQGVWEYCPAPGLMCWRSCRTLHLLSTAIPAWAFLNTPSLCFTLSSPGFSGELSQVEMNGLEQQCGKMQNNCGGRNLYSSTPHRERRWISFSIVYGKSLTNGTAPSYVLMNLSPVSRWQGTLTLGCRKSWWNTLQSPLLGGQQIRKKWWPYWKRGSITQAEALKRLLLLLLVECTFETMSHVRATSRMAFCRLWNVQKPSLCLASNWCQCSCQPSPFHGLLSEWLQVNARSSCFLPVL